MKNKDYHLTIKTIKDEPLATCYLDGEPVSMIQAQKNDTLTFQFDAPAGTSMTLSDAMVFAGPRKHSQHSSPIQKNQFPVKNGESVKIDNDGSWGFAIAFTMTQDSLSSFFFLPDPELEVGSHCD